jgi:SAM-dependent methyltransferase
MGMADQQVVRDQYAGAGKLAARQALWALRTGPGLAETVLDLAELGGAETVVDVGCGNGVYLAELRRRRHAGTVVGLDLSEGMARGSRRHAATAVADAQALPLRDGAADVVLSLHMLYHVPDKQRAVAELRRVLRPGGTAVVATNGEGHTAEIGRLLDEAAAEVGVRRRVEWDAFRPAAAADLLSGVFESVEVHEAGGVVEVRDLSVVVAYVASWPPEVLGLPAGPDWERVHAAVRGRLAGRDRFTVTSRATVLRCR